MSEAFGTGILLPHGRDEDISDPRTGLVFEKGRMLHCYCAATVYCNPWAF